MLQVYKRMQKMREKYVDTLAKLYEYAKSLSTNEDFGLVMDYLLANQLSGHLLETRLDVGIHYEGWRVKDVANFLKKLGYNEDAAQEIFNLLIETPSQYAAYGYGKYVFTKIHNEAKETLGNYYDEERYGNVRGHGVGFVIAEEDLDKIFEIAAELSK